MNLKHNLRMESSSFHIKTAVDRGDNNQLSYFNSKYFLHIITNDKDLLNVNGQLQNVILVHIREY